MHSVALALCIRFGYGSNVRTCVRMCMCTVQYVRIMCSYVYICRGVSLHVYMCMNVCMRSNCLLVLRTCGLLQIHSFSATDMDIGPNADLTYMIDEVATVPAGMADYSNSFSLGSKSTTP